jgi:glucosamine-phosphate N-acetyltransferase
MINFKQQISNDGYPIRKLEKEDYDKGFTEVLSVLSPTNISKEEFNHLFSLINYNTNHIIIVIEKDNKIVATGKLLVEYRFSYSSNKDFGKVGHIEDIVVRKEEHGKGYGTQIVNTLIQLCKEINCYKCILNSNDHNLEFYKKLGFKKTENTMRLDII